MSSALRNLRVLDFSRVLAGPLATMLLADLGAEVIKVERPGTGDDTRHWGRRMTPAVKPPTSTRSTATSQASRSASLTRPRLLSRTSARASWTVSGSGYETLAAANPALVFCSITGFGRGAGATLPGYDLLIQAVGGLMSITGSPDGEPHKVGVALVDVLTGLFATVGILATLGHRDATGEGQRVEIDLLSCLLAGLVNQASAYTAGGVVPSRLGNARPRASPRTNCTRAPKVSSSSPSAMIVSSRRCDALGATALAGDERFATNAARVAHRDARCAPNSSSASPPGRRVGPGAHRRPRAGRRGIAPSARSISGGGNQQRIEEPLSKKPRCSTLTTRCAAWLIPLVAPLSARARGDPTARGPRRVRSGSRRRAGRSR